MGALLTPGHCCRDVAELLLLGGIEEAYAAPPPNSFPPCASSVRDPQGSASPGAMWPDPGARSVAAPSLRLAVRVVQRGPYTDAVPWVRVELCRCGTGILGRFCM